jgi:hypothetical protein
MTHQTVQIKISTQKERGAKLKVVSMQGDFGSRYEKAHKKALKQHQVINNCDSLMAR